MLQHTLTQAGFAPLSHVVCSPLHNGSLPHRPTLVLKHCYRRTRHRLLVYGVTSDDEVEPVPLPMVSTLSSEAELAAEAEWVECMTNCWLNEEWPARELLQVHRDLSKSAGQAYCKLRRQEGVEDMGDLVLGLASELMAFDFHPTFTDAFSVANKVVELLMLRQGCDVCCTSDSDKTAIARYEAQLAAGSAEGS